MVAFTSSHVRTLSG